MAKFDLGGAGSGAISGAGAGSMFGAPGSAIGALFGSLFGGFGGKQKKPSMQSTLDPRQRKLYEQLYEGLEGRGGYADLFNFDPARMQDYYQKNFVNPAMEQFEQTLAPKITGQFRGGNLGQSSYAGQAIGRAGADVQKDLDAQLARLIYEGENAATQRRLGTVQNLLGMSTQAMDQGEDNYILELFKSLGPQALKMFAQKFGPQPKNYSPY